MTEVGASNASPTSMAALLAASPPHNSRFYTVAVDGRGGSGKTRLAGHLALLLPDLALVNGDDWFEPLDGELAWGEFNEERFALDVVGPLARGDATFTQQAYDFGLGALVEARPTGTAGGVIVERCFSFALPVDWDLRVWVETPRDVCLQRGIARDLLPAERVRTVWADLWQPKEDAYIAEQRPLESADLVIDGTGAYAQQVS